MISTIYLLRESDNIEDIRIDRYSFDPSQSTTIINMSSACVFYGDTPKEEKDRNILLTNKDTGVTIIGIIDVSSKSQGKPASERVRVINRTVFSSKEAARKASIRLVQATKARDAVIRKAQEDYKSEFRSITNTRALW